MNHNLKKTLKSKANNNEINENNGKIKIMRINKKTKEKQYNENK